MKKFFTLSVVLSFLLLTANVYGQLTVTIGAGANSTATSSNSATGNPGPIYNSGTTSSFNWNRHHYLYDATELAAAGIPGGAVITKVEWFKVNANGTIATTGNIVFDMYMKNSALTQVTAAGADFNTLIAGATQVYSTTSQVIPQTAGAVDFTLTTPFVYTGQALEITTDWDISGTSPKAVNGAWGWVNDPITDRNISYAGGSFGTSLSAARTVRPQIRISYTVPGACGIPLSSTVTNITATTADLTWTPDAANGAFEVEYGPAGFALGTGTVVTGTYPGAQPPVSISSLTPLTNYEWYIFETCNSGADSSFHLGPMPFQTQCATTFSGAYTIDPGQALSATNYHTFAGIVADMQTCGITGPTTVTVAAGTYNENIHLTNAISGLSATNTLTFDGVDSSTTTLTYSSASDIATVHLDGVSWVTVKNFRIENTSTSDGWGVFLINQADHNTIDACRIVMPVTTTTDIIGIVASGNITSETTNGNSANYLTISNCHISGGEKNIHLQGNGATGFTIGNRIINNTLEGGDDDGIEVSWQDSLTIFGNTLTSTVTTYNGLDLNDVSNFDISSNLIICDDIGIDFDDANDAHTPTIRSTMINNMIYSSVDDGFNCDDCEEIDIFHNTIVGEPAFQINDQVDFDVRNNIFFSNGLQALFSSDAPGTNDIIDYNVYYSGGANIASVAGTLFADLAALQAADATRNVNSLEGDPVFIPTAAIDLHLLGTLANDVGDNTVGVTTDIDGDTRPISPSTTVDIGADEYNLPACPPPSTITFTQAGSDSIVVSWITGGSTTWDLEWGPTGFTTGTGLVITTTDNPYVITGLAPNTAYDLYINDNCTATGDGTSLVAGPYTFRTTCSDLTPATLPVVEDFESAGIGLSFNTDQDVLCGTTHKLRYETLNPGDGRLRFGVSGFAKNGNGSATLDEGAGVTTPVNYLIMEVDLTNYTTSTDLELEFSYLNHAEANHADDRVWIRGSENDPWLEIYNLFANQASSGNYKDVRGIDIDALLALGSQTVSSSFQVRFGQAGTGSATSITGVDGYTFDDIAIREITCQPPTALTVNVLTSDSAYVSWTPGDGADWIIEWGPTGFTQGTNPGGIATVTDTTFGINGLASSTGYEFYVRDSCGPGKSPWTGPFSFTTLCPAVNAPFIENFDGTAWVASGSNSNNQLDPCWASNPNSSDPANNGEPFKWIPRSTNPSSGNGPLNDHTTGSGNYLYVEASSSAAGDVALLTTPPIDLSTLTTTPALYFWYHRFSTNLADLTVEITNDGGATWTQVFFLTGQTQTSAAAPWLEAFVDLFAYDDEIVQIRFRADGFGCCGDQAIDDVRLDEGPACAEPSAFNISNVTTNGGDFGWSSSGSTWDLEWGPVGFIPGSGNGIDSVTTTNNPHTISTMTPNTNYDIYVRNNCGGLFSDWVGPITFKTLCLSSLNGTYTLGGASSDFPTFDSLATNLTACGIAGPVLINVQPGTYNENFDLGSITGSSSTNVLTIDGGDATQVTLTHDASITNGTVMLNGTSHITFKNMTMTNTKGSGDSWIIHMQNTDYVTVDSCVIQQPVVTTFEVSGIVGSGSLTSTTTEVTNNHLTVTNSSFTGGEHGIVLEGVTASKDVGNTFTHNTFTNIDDHAIEVDAQDSLTISWNTVVNTNNISSSQINCFDIHDFEISYNSLLNAPDEGITVSTASAASSTSRSSIHNNMVFAPNDAAIRASVTSNTNVYHNTSVGLVGFEITSASSEMDIMNNIFIGIGGGATTKAFDATTATGTTVSIDYNIYDSDGTNIAENGTSNFTDIASWQIADFLNNQNSLEGNPVLVSTVAPADLHALGGLANDVGNNAVGITTDIDGDTRPIAPSTTVDIGADEFTPASCLPSTGVTAYGISVSDANITWTPGGGASDWNIEYGVAPLAQGSGTIINATNDTINISALSANTTYEYYLRDSCAVGDVSVWVGPFSFHTLCTVFSVPFVENFDGPTWVASGTNAGNQLDPCWSSNPNSSDPSTDAEPFKWIPRSTGPTSGNGPLQDNTTGTGNFVYTEASSSATGDIAYLMTPAVSLASVDTPELHFWYHRFSTPIPDLDIEVSNDFGTTWSASLFNLTGQVQATSGAEWLEAVVDLTTYSGDTVMVRFKASGLGCCADQAIDDVSIVEKPTCFVPDSVGFTNQTTTSLDLFWQTGGASDWEIEYGPEGFTPGSGTRISATNDTTTISPLSPDVLYDFYVRDSCGLGDVSLWVGPITTVLYPCDDFDSYVTGFLPPQSPLWFPWQGGTAIDGDVSTDFAQSGTQSLKIHDSGTNGSSDVVLKLGDKTTGVHQFSLSFMIPTAANNGGYYNILHDYNDAGTNVWAIEVLLDGATGIAQVDMGTNATGTIGTYNFNTNAWNTVDHIIDLDNDTAWIVVNGVNTIGWQWSLGSTNFGNQLSASNLFSNAPTGQTPLIYFDDVCLSPYVPSTCADPTPVTITNITAATADVNWVSTGNNFEIEWDTTGFPLGQGTNSITGITSSPHTITGLTTSQTYDVYVREVCGPNDTSNWVLASFSTPCGVLTPAILPETEDFESAGTGIHRVDATVLCEPTHHFLFETSDQGEGRLRFGLAGYANNGIGAATLDKDPSGTVTTNYLIMAIDMSNYTTSTSLELEFSYMHHGEETHPNDRVWVRGSDADAWIEIYDLFANRGTVGVYNNVMGLDIDAALAGATPSQTVSSTFQIRFGQEDDFPSTTLTASDGFTFDDISVIETAPACPAPTALDTVSVDFTSADITWTTGGAMNWNVEWGAQGFTQGAGTLVLATNDTITLGSLTKNTCYDFYVQDSCGLGNVSVWTGPFTFCTDSCPTPTAAFTFTPNPPAAGDSVFTFDASGSTNADSLHWDFGDGTTIANGSVNESHTYDELSNGGVTVTLTVCTQCVDGSDSCVTVTQNVGVNGISVYEYSIDNSLELFPNPTNDKFDLNFTSVTGQDLEIRIVSTLGQVIYTEALSNFAGEYNNTISIGEQPKGIYFLQIITKDGIVNRRIALQ